MMPGRRSAVGVLLAATLGFTASSSGSHGETAARRCPHAHWVAAWSTSPSDGGAHLSDQTIRMVVTPHVGGSRIRLHLSNRFGSEPLTVRDVRIARSGGGATIVGPDPSVEFGGRGRVEIPAGEDAVSDPVSLRMTAMRPLAMTAHVPGAVSEVTRHAGAQQTSYLSPPGTGDVGTDREGAALAGHVTSWFVLDGIDVSTPRRIGAIAAFGDSLTEGAGSPFDTDMRYPDDLARRLLARHGAGSPSVMNAGISFNGLIIDAGPGTGQAGRIRIRKDVFRQSGVTDAILLEGANDLAIFKPRDVIYYTRRVLTRLGNRGFNVLVGTHPPRDGSSHDQLERINRWIRTKADATVVDFDLVLRDPSDPTRLAPEYDSGDGTHPNAAGYEAMASAVPLSQLDGRTCARQ
jgi:lysophospholipase L1-like esterase